MEMGEEEGEEESESEGKGRDETGRSGKPGKAGKGPQEWIGKQEVVGASTSQTQTARGACTEERRGQRRGAAAPQSI